MLNGASLYDAVYATLGGLFVSIGAPEPQFFAELLRLLGIDPDKLPAQNDANRWPEMRSPVGSELSDKNACPMVRDTRRR